MIFYKHDNKSNRTILPILSASNAIVNEWNRTWGGSDYDYGNGVAVDSSGNIYVAGYTDSFGAGSRDMCLVKYTSFGVQQWNRTWGGSSSDYGYGVAVDSSGNIYVAGYTDSFGAGGGDLCLVKYNSSGVQQWNRTWGGSSSDYGHEVAIDSLDNIYIVGYTYVLREGSSVCVVKYDSLGVQQWNRTWGGRSLASEGHGVAIDSLDNIYIVGDVCGLGAGYYDMSLVKYDSLGVQQWNRTWGGIGGDYGRGVTVDSLGNIYIVGYTYNFGVGNGDLCLVKYDSSGVQQWNRTWGGSNYDKGCGLTFDSSDNIYILGWTTSFGAGIEICLVKYDSLGVQHLNHTWGGCVGDYGNGVAVDFLRNIYIVGYIYTSGGENSYVCVLKFNIDSDGDGLSDAQEILFGYDPNNAWSNPSMVMIIIIIIILAILGIPLFIIYLKVIRNREKERLEREQEERERREKESV